MSTTREMTTSRYKICLASLFFLPAMFILSININGRSLLSVITFTPSFVPSYFASPTRLLTSAEVPIIDVDGINCSAVFEGDAREIQKAANYTPRAHADQQLGTGTSSRSTTNLMFPEEYYENATADCVAFIKQRGYATRPVNEEELEFPLAFSILMYKDVGQFERLLRMIYRPQNFYCVHVDRKSPNGTQVAVRAILSCFENVFLPDEIYEVKWSSFTVLAPELACMRKLLRASGKWKYFINLTGQEFPLKTNWQIVRILKAFNGSNNMEGTIRGRNMYRYAGVPPAPCNFTVTKGSVHVVATRGYVEFAIYDNRSRDFLKWVELTKVPDETFFSSLNHSPQLGVHGSYRGIPETNDKTYPFLVRFKNWGTWPCRGKMSNSLCIFGPGDLRLLSQRRELFANKFHANFTPRAYDCLEQRHYDNVRREIEAQRRLGDCVSTFNSAEYSKFDFVRNHVS